MTVEQAIFDALSALVATRVYPDFAPPGIARPYLTFQQMGGTPVNFMDSGTANLSNARFRINVWADTRLEAAALCRAAEQALRATPALRTTVETNPVALADPETRLRGTSQDFSFWFP